MPYSPPIIITYFILPASLESVNDIIDMLVYQSMKISIQGEKGSFHYTATKLLLSEEVSVISCKNFSETINMLVSGKSDQALVAIENSLFGSINEVYDLLLTNNVTIQAEVYLRIQQCLIGLPGTRLSDIKEVHSHPVALAQCEAFLDDKLPDVERFEHHDTAGSVADVKLWGDPSKAAIASQEAAELHSLEVIRSEIETNKQNYTRFVLLTKKTDIIPKEANKTSLVLRTPEDVKAGSLYQALGVFAKNNVNLFVLHSRPIIGKAWHYMFYLDIDSSPNQENFEIMIKDLSKQGCQISILGSYKNNML